MRQVTLKEVSRAYGRHFALHRVSSTFEAGSITALLGGNGAGKTTLLNILATLDAPTKGSIHYDQNPWALFSKKGRQHVGWVSHEPLLYPTLTGRENLTFYARMYGLRDPHERLESLLAQVAMDAHADQRVENYSRGMVQRLTIARALLHDPSLLLLDEPLTGIDRQGRATIKALFESLRQQGKILVMSTHDLHILGDMCQRLDILKRGKLVFSERVTDTQDIIHAYEAHA